MDTSTNDNDMLILVLFYAEAMVLIHHNHIHAREHSCLFSISTDKFPAHLTAT